MGCLAKWGEPLLGSPIPWGVSVPVPVLLPVPASGCCTPQEAAGGALSGWMSAAPVLLLKACHISHFPSSCFRPVSLLH